VPATCPSTSATISRQRGLRIGGDVVESAQVRAVDAGLPARAELIVCQQRHDPRHLVAPRVPEDHHVTSP
jgi:hypothetical protein